MSVPTLNARTLRVVRWVQVAGLILSAADLARNLLMGYAALAPAVMIVLWLALICAQTKLIRRREELERPRPDYSAIAAMEREVYGETFQHEGAPDRRRGFELSSPEVMREARSALRKPPKPRRPTFEDDRRAMRELAAASRRVRHPSGYCDCARCGGSRRADEDLCYRCNEREHEERHPDTTQPAAIGQYVAWLRGYVERGGKVTYSYDYPFSRVGFRYAGRRVTVDSDYEYGARARRIIIAAGVTTERTRPGEAFSGWGHTNCYFMHGYRTNTPDWVPVYSDPEFDAFR